MRGAQGDEGSSGELRADQGRSGRSGEIRHLDAARLEKSARGDEDEDDGEHLLHRVEVVGDGGEEEVDGAQPEERDGLGGDEEEGRGGEGEHDGHLRGGQ